jgi:hypothetical protein
MSPLAKSFHERVCTTAACCHAGTASFFPENVADAAIPVLSDRKARLSGLVQPSRFFCEK